MKITFEIASPGPTGRATPTPNIHTIPRGQSTIGSWGDVLGFQVSSDSQFTFKNISRSHSGRWHDHNILGGKPRSEFIGAGLQSLTMTIQLSAAFGVSPMEVIEKLETAVAEGEAEYLFIGGKKIGEEKMKLTGMSETWGHVLNGGELVSANLSLTFSEYIESGDLVEYDPADEVKVPWEYIVGDEVQFNGGTYYTKAGEKGEPRSAAAGPAKVVKNKPGKPHPWKLKTKDKSKTKVKGWVNDGAFT